VLGLLVLFTFVSVFLLVIVVSAIVSRGLEQYEDRYATKGVQTLEGMFMFVTPRQLLRMAGDRLPAGYRRRLEGYKYGPGVFKVDWALDAPIPWTAPECRGAGPVHLGGTFEEISRALSSPVRKTCTRTVRSPSKRESSSESAKPSRTSATSRRSFTAS